MFEPAPRTLVAEAQRQQLRTKARAQCAGQAGADAPALGESAVELLGSKQPEPFLGRRRLDLRGSAMLAAAQAHLDCSELPEQPGARRRLNQRWLTSIAGVPDASTPHLVHQRAQLDVRRRHPRVAGSRREGGYTSQRRSVQTRLQTAYPAEELPHDRGIADDLGMADEPITPGAPEAGSEPTVEVVLEEPTDVIIQIIAFIATVAVLFVAWSLRVQKRAKQRRQKPKKRETLPGPADKAHVESLVRECSDAADDLVPELLAGLAASPVLVDEAKVSCLAARTSKQLRAGLAGCVAGWSELESMSLSPAAQQSLLLLLHQLYQHQVPESVLRLSDAELQQRDEVAALVGQLLLSAFEAACKQQRLRPGLALARLIACNSSGVWSWEEAECVQLCRETRPGLPHPRISVEASVKSWMGAPHLAPGSTMELSLTVHRQHAGPSDAPHERLAWRGHETVTHAPPQRTRHRDLHPHAQPHARVHRTYHTPHTTHHTHMNIYV